MSTTPPVMQYRKLTSSGDYTFGENLGDFYYNLNACAQAVYTGLNLFQGTFWRNLAAGVPMFQQIIGTPGSQNNLIVIDSILQNQILATPNVTQLVDYTSAFDGVTRTFTYTATVQTAYSTTPITITQSF